METNGEREFSDEAGVPQLCYSSNSSPGKQVAPAFTPNQLQLRLAQSFHFGHRFEISIEVAISCAVLLSSTFHRLATTEGVPA